MIISGKNMQHIARIYGEQAKQLKINKPEQPGKLSPDEVVLSAEAKEFSQLLQAAKAVPEVRTGMVEELQQKIASGTYQADSKAVAQKILQSWQNDRQR